MGLPSFAERQFTLYDRVRVEQSGRVGTIIRRCKPARDGWIVRWDVPVMGVTEGRVATVNLVHHKEDAVGFYREADTGRRLWVTPLGRVKVWEATHTSNRHQPSHKWFQIARPKNVERYVAQKLASGEWLTEADWMKRDPQVLALGQLQGEGRDNDDACS